MEALVNAQERPLTQMYVHFGPLKDVTSHLESTKKTIKLIEVVLVFKWSHGVPTFETGSSVIRWSSTQPSTKSARKLVKGPTVTQNLFVFDLFHLNKNIHAISYCLNNQSFMIPWFSKVLERYDRILCSRKIVEGKTVKTYNNIIQWGHT